MDVTCFDSLFPTGGLKRFKPPVGLGDSPTERGEKRLALLMLELFLKLWM